MERARGAAGKWLQTGLSNPGRDPHGACSQVDVVWASQPAELRMAHNSGHENSR